MGAPGRGSVCLKHEYRWSRFLLAAKQAHKVQTPGMNLLGAPRQATKTCI